MNTDDSIEAFRKEVRPELIKKGMKPPEEGDEIERGLYAKWLKGKKLLES